jgi:tRNA(fMet)-specific endonuclease VapC
MKYLLDTNICIYLINDRPKKVQDRFKRHHIGDIGISSITASELAFGVAKSGSAKNRIALEKFLLPLQIADYDAEAAMIYGEIRATLEAQGKPIGPLDMLIAAHAMSLRAVLVTNNEREFKRVSQLKVENWL